MLNRILLHNFQCYSKFDVEFDPHITTFVGPTDVGKSAIIRALKWIALNRPLGSAFIKDGTDQCKVMLLVDDVTVSRTKDKQNIYRLDGKTFKAFGNEVPDVIRQFLAVDELNFQQQHDPPFWLSLSSGEVAKHLNAIVDLSIIDNVQTKLQQRRRKASTECDVINSRLADIQDQIDSLSVVDELHESLLRLEKMERRIDDAASKLRGIREKLVRIRKVMSVMAFEMPSTERLDKVVQRYSELRKKSSRLEEIVERCTNVQADVNATKREARRLRSQLFKFDGKECPACGNLIKV